MELRGVRSLMLLAELGSISKAARELNLSPAAIHKQFKLLEVELGVKLYEKLPGRIRLTPAGQALVPHFRSLLECARSAMDSSAEAKGIPQGLVRIGGGMSFSVYLLPGLIARYRKRFPRVDLFVRAERLPGLIEDLESDRLDLAFLPTDELLAAAKNRLSIEATWKYEFVIVANRRFRSRTCSLAELQTQPFILYGKEFQLIEDYFEEMKVPLRVIMRFDDNDAIKAMVLAGLGMSVLPVWATDASIRSGELSLIRQRERPLFSNIVLVRRKSGYVSKATQEFIDMTKEFGFGRSRLVHSLRSN
jgi:DNA-binding transcriptional LysR family regulator